MQDLTSFDVSNLVKESSFLAGSKIENIYQTDSKNLYLQIYVKDKPKQLLRIISGKAFFLTKLKPEMPENLMRFCSYLRKYLLNARIKSIEQINHERIIKIWLETKEIEYNLVAELFGKGNIILISKDKISSVLEEQTWADRKLAPGETYSYPKIESSDELFKKQKQKGSDITMEVLDEEFSKTIQSKSVTAKQKETQRIKTIIEKQEEQLEKAIKESNLNKRKGELIYEHYVELKEKINKTDKKERTLKVKLE